MTESLTIIILCIIFTTCIILLKPLTSALVILSLSLFIALINALLVSSWYVFFAFIIYIREIIILFSFFISILLIILSVIIIVISFIWSSFESILITPTGYKLVLYMGRILFCYPIIIILLNLFLLIIVPLIPSPDLLPIVRIWELNDFYSSTKAFCIVEETVETSQPQTLNTPHSPGTSHFNIFYPGPITTPQGVDLRPEPSLTLFIIPPQEDLVTFFNRDSTIPQSLLVTEARGSLHDEPKIVPPISYISEGPTQSTSISESGSDSLPSTARIVLNWLPPIPSDSSLGHIFTHHCKTCHDDHFYMWLTNHDIGPEIIKSWHLHYHHPEPTSTNWLRDWFCRYLPVPSSIWAQNCSDITEKAINFCCPNFCPIPPSEPAPVLQGPLIIVPDESEPWASQTLIDKDRLHSTNRSIPLFVVYDTSTGVTNLGSTLSNVCPLHYLKFSLATIVAYEPCPYYCCKDLFSFLNNIQPNYETSTITHQPTPTPHISTELNINYPRTTPWIRETVRTLIEGPITCSEIQEIPASYTNTLRESIIFYNLLHTGLL